VKSRSTPRDFIDQIIEFEAASMLADLVMSPALMDIMFVSDEERRKAAVDFVTSILRQHFDGKHLHIAVSHGDDELYGYAMLFTDPGQETKYLHKIYVFEDFRGQGIGQSLLDSVISDGGPTALLCSPELERFYEKKGFKFAQEFRVPDSEEFRLSRNLYSGLIFMGNSSGSMRAPVFMLNDVDIRRIKSLVLNA
jgi:GNAT superfamily N-acetyltransferase